MKVAFVSNYINHHQIPFCNEMYGLLEGEFVFVQTEVMEAERVRMGWHEEEQPAYVRCWYQEEEFCRRLVLECDVVLFGGTDNESYIQERLQAQKPVIRISERLYRMGQWKAVSPRGLRKKYIDHTRYRKKPVYLLCAGAYVPSDFHIVRAYPGKMYCWGYFPEARCYDLETLFAGKGWERERGDRLPYLLWAGRMLELKHPELALETARYLREQGIAFHMDIIGGGELQEEMEALRKIYGLEDCVGFPGFLSPEEVRLYMERADIFLFTSDRQEGWGAVVNEAMNSGCALVADHMIGAVPYLVDHGHNGLVYRDGDRQGLFSLVGRLTEDPQLCRELGENAYHTITETWNAKKAAESLLQLMENVIEGDVAPQQGAVEACFQGGLRPCAPAPVLSERFARRRAERLTGEGDWIQDE